MNLGYYCSLYIPGKNQLVPDRVLPRLFILPISYIDLPKISSKIDNVETVEQSVKQTYQEDHNPWDKVISKRQGLLDRLLPFRRKKPKPHPPREVRPKRKPDQKIPRYVAKY